MLTQDKIKEEWLIEFHQWWEEQPSGDSCAKESKAITDWWLAHLSAQYEKLIGEVIPEYSMNANVSEYYSGFNAALRTIRTSLQERGIKIK